MKRQRQPKASGGPPADRAVDMEAIGKINGLTSLLDVAFVRFSAESKAILRDEQVGRLTQVLRYRAAPVPGTAPGIVVVLAEFDYEALHDQESMINISGNIAVFYGLRGEPSFPEEDLQQFAEVNGVYTAWPYLREFIGTAAARFGVAGVVLPLWKIPNSLRPRGEWESITREASVPELPDPTGS